MIIATVSLLVAGCSLGDDTVEAPTPPPAQVHDHWPGCLKLGAFEYHGKGPPEAGSIPADFTAQAAVWCAYSDSLDQQAERGLERRATMIGPLLRSLRRPSRVAAGGSDGSCPAIGFLPIWLFLIDDDGHWIVPRIPTDACGIPLVDTGDSKPAWQTAPYTDRVVCTVHSVGSTETCR